MDYSHGSSAYKYEVMQEEQDRARIEYRHARQKHEERINKTFRTAVKLFVIGLSACFMISKYVAVDDTGKRIKELEKELNAQQTYASEKAFELEQKVSLTAIEEAAMTRLGMQRPDKTQTIYVDIKKDDYTERTAQEVEGVRNKVGSALKNAKQTLINIFALK